MRLFNQAALVLAVWSVFGVAVAEAEERGRYSHVIRLTAGIEFDGQRVDFDELIDCQTHYTGPPERAVQLGMRASRTQFAGALPQGGMVFFRVQRNVCIAFTEKWAGIESTLSFAEGWTPILYWFNHRDPAKATKGEMYRSERALTRPNGRLKIVEDFRVKYPEQTEEIIAEAAQQVADRRVFLSPKPGAGNHSLGLKQLPWFYRLPESLWRNPPENPSFSNGESDHLALVTFLDAQPSGDGILFLGDEIRTGLYDDARKTIRDYLRHANNSANAISYIGIPQKSRQDLGLFASREYKERALKEVGLAPFLDDFVPAEIHEGTMRLRPDLQGQSFLYEGYRDWYLRTGRHVNFLGIDFPNETYEVENEYLILDQRNGDLWVRFHF